MVAKKPLLGCFSDAGSFTIHENFCATMNAAAYGQCTLLEFMFEESCEYF